MMVGFAGVVAPPPPAGGVGGFELSVRIVQQALDRLDPGGRLVLYTATPVFDGRDALREALEPTLSRASAFDYRELDPDVFGEELERPSYEAAERLSAPLLALLDAGSEGAGHWREADAARLTAVRADRAAAAALYFAARAEQWDAVRSLHVPDSAVEDRLLAMLGPDLGRHEQRAGHVRARDRPATRRRRRWRDAHAPSRASARAAAY